jgi:4-aminobutyrate aminotransferase-like enzyme
VAGVICQPHLVERFGQCAAYFNTFGGSPVAAAVGMAVLEVIEAEGLQANAARVGALLQAGFGSLAARYPQLGEVRGAGLFIGVDVLDSEGRADTQGARRLVNALRDEGVLIGASGPASNVLKIRPPLCLNAAQGERFLQVLETVLARS